MAILNFSSSNWLPQPQICLFVSIFFRQPTSSHIMLLVRVGGKIPKSSSVHLAAVFALGHQDRPLYCTNHEGSAVGFTSPSGGAAREELAAPEVGEWGAEEEALASCVIALTPLCLI